MNDNNVSVSKGVFVYNKEGVSQHKRVKSLQYGSTGSDNIFSNKLWYQSYNKMWRSLEKKIKTLNNDMFANLLRNLVISIKNSYNNPVTEIPTATLLTGINMPDHSAQFSALSKEIQKTVTPHVAVLHAEDCQNLKYVVENTVDQLMNKTESNSDEEEIDTESTTSKIRKTYCTFSLLQSWYEKLYGSPETRNCSPVKRKTRNGHKLLVVIIPDFESFNQKIVQAFILIISSYLNILPFVLVFGVATSLSAVHKALPYHVSSKISVQIFNSQQSTVHLNNVIEHVFFTDDCPFHLGGKVFNLFTDIFLYYDLSVKGFIKNFKFAMLEHFSYGNIMALCTNTKNMKKVLDQLSPRDLENLRSLASVQGFSEKQTPKKKSKLSEDDEYFKTIICEQLQEFYAYLNTLHLFLKCLHVLVHDLPNAPLGKQIRELYSLATSNNITETLEYKECFQLVGFQSKDELSSKVSKICKFLEEEISANKINKRMLEEVLDDLEDHLNNIETATTIVEEEPKDEMHPTEHLLFGKMDRKQLKEKLLEMSKKSKSMNKYERMRSELVKYLQNMFERFLQEPQSKPFHEIFFFRDMSIKRKIIGSHRAAIHAALNDPQYYLQCECCTLQNEATILPCMPDISILYKLHLEYGKLINLYDWLQSFLSIVDPDDTSDEEERRTVEPELQARFTQGVADLEFLGFIKSSKRKTDHVLRLTWGG